MPGVVMAICTRGGSMEVELTMINMPYLQTFITTGLLHLKQSLTQQRSVGWIRVSKAPDANIYYKLSFSKSLQVFADRSITYGFHLQPDSIGNCWEVFPKRQTNDF